MYNPEWHNINMQIKKKKRKKATVFSPMLLSAHICRQRYPSESTISILQHLMHQQLTTNRIKILSPFQKKTAREAYVFAKTTKNYLSVAIRLVSPETLSPQSILLKFSIPKTLSRSSTHTLMYVQWGHGGFGYQIALFFFFFPPLNWMETFHTSVSNLPKTFCMKN